VAIDTVSLAASCWGCGADCVCAVDIVIVVVVDSIVDGEDRENWGGENLGSNDPSFLAGGGFDTGGDEVVTMTVGFGGNGFGDDVNVTRVFPPERLLTGVGIEDEEESDRFLGISENFCNICEIPTPVFADTSMYSAFNFAAISFPASEVTTRSISSLFPSTKILGVFFASG